MMSKIRHILCVMLFSIPAFVCICSGQERINLSLDQKLCVAGDSLAYQAGYFLDQEMSSKPMSKVLYVELITNTGKKIAQTKNCFSDSIVSGKLAVPGDTKSGNYYLRAYTKYMRNFPPETYSYQLVAIVNPFSAEVLQEMQFPDPGQKDARMYKPEIYGLTISGQLLGSDGQAPPAGAEISISTVSDASYFSITESDSAGNFVFDLPWDLQSREFSISVAGYEQGELPILVDSEFCNKKVQLEYVPFVIGDEEEVLALVRAYQKKVYRSTARQEDIQEAAALPFYGKPGRVVLEKDYIELKSIGEFVFELLYEFKYDPSAGYLYPTGNFPLKYFPVLVLLDNVRVYDLESFLDLPARRINRFEMIRGGYIIGEKSFGGILNVFSEDGDMAGFADQTDRIYFLFGTACQGGTTPPQMTTNRK